VKGSFNSTAGEDKEKKSRPLVCVLARIKKASESLANKGTTGGMTSEDFSGQKKKKSPKQTAKEKIGVSTAGTGKLRGNHWGG